MTTATAPQASTQLPPLIPREVLFGNPTRTSPRLSPNGQNLAYIAPDDSDVLQVWLQSSDGDRQLTQDKKRGIRMFFWTYEPGQLVYLQDSDGDENFHLYLVDIDTSMVRDLTPFQGVKAQFIDSDRDHPNALLVGLNLKNSQTFDVYRIDLKSGAVEFVAANPGNIVSWEADANFEIRAAAAATSDGGSELLYRASADADWETLRRWGPDDEGGPSHFSKDGKTLYIIGNHDANAQRLIALDLDNRTETVLAEDPQYDLSGILLHPQTRELQAVSFYEDKVRWQVFDADVAEDLEAIAQIRNGEFAIASRTDDDTVWLVAFLTDDGPVYYYRYERATKHAELMFSHRPELEALSLSSMQAIEYTARDGLTIHGYLSTPVGVPAENLPTVLHVHGGPWARDTWGYSPSVQWLTNRGYAVLQVNFRGSTGYGKAFLNAGNRQWGAAMHDDLLDAVEWLKAKGISDPDRIAIMGGSYGGYATLVGLAFTPEVFACGVDIVGPSNLVTLIQSVPPYWKPLMAMFAHRVGNLETEEDFLKARSPLFICDRIQKPLLIGQGANDPRVKQAESEQIVDAMHAAGKPVEYALYTDEGHGFARPENRMHFYALAEEFLAKYLGGRAEPIGELTGHSGIVR
ncbi:dipeptidyl aminopeptidase/acylaminoacyl-peptidase [Rubidibacter lacunae KORDI 51-2]|uniref:Dipeptidyl aminopeptidase/acylaminoacyl-peptidase n=1 Tax=Rubidibacter lacunae KORDI 51-2 TaxID=582515 RepID=U5DLE9_9CHRO|nr:S9 family peptidase [Rubidibacter lacunae]ERN40540.1 dipeptidyl aminopeptidase/acylaminoacyl-peptidase [Rubidibacter lacunae KORDI 51-2]